MAPRLLADARPGACAVRGRAASRGRHRALRAPGGRPVRHPDRAHGGAARASRQELQRPCARGGAALGRGGDRGRRARGRGAARLGSRRGGRGGGRRRFGARGSRREPALLVRARDRRGQDRGRTRVRRGLAHRRRADPHPPPQPRGPVPGRAARPRLPRPHLPSAPAQERRRAARRRPRDRRDLPVVRSQRRQDLGRLHDRHLRRGAYRARREDQRVDPPVDRPRVHRHDGHRRADRAPRDRPLPHADLALRPGPGGPARRDRAASLRSHPARRGRALDRERAAPPRRGGPGLRPGGAGRPARPDALQPGGGRSLQDPLQGRARRRLLGRGEARAQRGQGVPGRRHQGQGGVR